MGDGVIVRKLGLVEYEIIYQQMKEFTLSRTIDTPDEIWLVEHPPVYTQGQAGKSEHILNPHTIPIIQTDRGGQVTYHAPGQLILYPLINFKRLKIGVRSLVIALEESIIQTLKEYGIEAYGMRDAPGVYVNEAKIASLGLRIKNGALYHGLSLNVAMDLTPFDWINPCGYKGLRMTQMKDELDKRGRACPSLDQVGHQLTTHLITKINHLQAEAGRGS